MMIGKDRRTFRKILAVMIAFCIALPLAPVSTLAAESGILINESNFPDQKLRDHLKEKYDKNGDNRLAPDEIDGVTYLNVSDLGLTSMKGVEHFKNLYGISCSDNHLTDFSDLSSPQNITHISCYNNKFVSLDMSRYPNLQVLNCGDNQLTSLNVSKNTELSTLSCDNNNLRGLDVSQNAKLTNLSCLKNQLETLDLSANINLESLNCAGNHLSVLDLTKLSKVTATVGEDDKPARPRQTRTATATFSNGKYQVDMADLVGGANVKNVAVIDGVYPYENHIVSLGDSLPVTFQYRYNTGAKYSGEPVLMTVAVTVEASQSPVTPVTPPAPTVKHTVRFDASGGSAVKDQIVEHGGKVTLPPNPTRTGYTFDVWYNGSKEWNFGTDTVTSDITLTAHWIKIPTGNPPKPQTVKPPKAGTKLKDTRSKATYKVAKAKSAVTYTGTMSKKATSVSVPATVKINGITYKVTSIDSNAFKGNKKLTKVTIGKNVTSIGAGAFQNCTALKTVKIDSKVTSVGSKAFYGCKKLTSVTIGEKVTTIGAAAFQNCSKLTKITIPAKVKKIGKQAFYKCKNLKNIMIKTTKLTKKNVGSKAFSGINSKAKIKVPKKKLEAYKSLLKSKGIGKKVRVTKK